MLARLKLAAAVSVLALGLAACSNEAAPPAAETASPATADQAANASPAQLAAAPAPTPAPVTVAAAPEAAPPATAAPASSPDHAALHQPAGPAVVPFESSAAVTNHTLPIARIKNFKLKDQNGKVHELYKMTDAKAIVLSMHTKGCPIGQQLMPDFNELHAQYENRGVKFLMMNSNSYDTPEMIAQEARDFKLSVPILKDADQSVGEPLGVERSTETLVIEPGTWRILYQGPINDRVTYGRARAKATVNFVPAVLDAMLAGKAVQPSYVHPEGCILVFENRKS